ncbi:acylphosphatase [Kitasatospora phosalacinea]|uniref:acylphosphatase n=1 Tax=Kitasatospora phosalacinea TaxID=2065 RepID=UPI000A5A875C|nr:acylphosphatase [Kitasatospora phosalacinea]
MIRRRVLVSGTVQGVFFRDSCRRAAAEAEVVGWVRNLPDGRVEAVFEGDPDPVEQMVAWTHHGPPRAVVDHVEVHEEQPEGLLVFAITT